MRLYRKSLILLLVFSIMTLRITAQGVPADAADPKQADALYEQAKKFAQAFLRGQPHKATIATTLFRDKIQQLRS